MAIEDDFVVSYTPGSNPGDWRPTPPAFAPGAFPQWPNVTTWTLTSGSQFLPPGAPQLGSAEYAASPNQVKEIGSAVPATIILFGPRFASGYLFNWRWSRLRLSLLAAVPVR